MFGSLQPVLIYIRDSLPNRSIVVVNFPKASDATEFVEAYNGKPFNSMEVSVESLYYKLHNQTVEYSQRHAMSSVFYLWK